MDHLSKMPLICQSNGITTSPLSATTCPVRKGLMLTILNCWVHTFDQILAIIPFAQTQSAVLVVISIPIGM